MIFAALGTHGDPMPRLVDVLETLIASAGELGPFEIQHGSSALPRGWVGRMVYAPKEMEALMRRADIVISHGGPATIASARGAGKVPIVVPRLQRFREHVDDHQLWYARLLSERGEILLAETVDNVSELVRDYSLLISRLPPPTAHDPGPAIARFTEIAEAVIRG